MTVFAIRQKSTGYFMPAGRGRGFTHDVPAPALVRPPRLFLSRAAAGSALRWWLEGECVVKHRAGVYGDVDEDWTTDKPATPRIAEDMEVVPLSLSAEVSL